MPLYISMVKRDSTYASKDGSEGSIYLRRGLGECELRDLPDRVRRSRPYSLNLASSLEDQVRLCNWVGPLAEVDYWGFCFPSHVNLVIN